MAPSAPAAAPRNERGVRCADGVRIAISTTGVVWFSRGTGAHSRTRRGCDIEFQGRSQARWMTGPSAMVSETARPVPAHRRRPRRARASAATVASGPGSPAVMKVTRPVLLLDLKWRRCGDTGHGMLSLSVEGGRITRLRAIRPTQYWGSVPHMKSIHALRHGMNVLVATAGQVGSTIGLSARWPPAWPRRPARATIPGRDDAFV